MGCGFFILIETHGRVVRKSMKQINMAWEKIKSVRGINEAKLNQQK